MEHPQEHDEEAFSSPTSKTSTKPGDTCGTENHREDEEDEDEENPAMPINGAENEKPDEEEHNPPTQEEGSLQVLAECASDSFASPIALSFEHIATQLAERIQLLGTSTQREQAVFFFQQAWCQVCAAVNPPVAPNDLQANEGPPVQDPARIVQIQPKPVGIIQGRNCWIRLRNIPTIVSCMRLLIVNIGGALSGQEVTESFISGSTPVSVVPMHGNASWKTRPDQATSRIGPNKTGRRKIDKDVSHSLGFRVELRDGSQDMYRWREKLVVIGRGSSNSNGETVKKDLLIDWSALLLDRTQ